MLAQVVSPDGESMIQIDTEATNATTPDALGTGSPTTSSPKAPSISSPQRRLIGPPATSPRQKKYCHTSNFANTEPCRLSGRLAIRSGPHRKIAVIGECYVKHFKDLQHKNLQD